MDLLCPRCSKALSVPEQMAGRMVQCPFCTTVLQVPAAMSPAYAAAAATAPAAASTHPAAPGTSMPDFGGLPSRPLPRPRKKGNHTAGVMMLGMAVVLAIGLAVVVFVASQKQQQDQQTLGPMQMASAQAQEFVRQNLPDARQLQFPTEGIRTAQTTYGGWLIESDVDVTDAHDRTGRQSWKAELRPVANGQWELLRLEIGGEVVRTWQHTAKAQEKKADDEPMEFDPFGGNSRPGRLEDDYYRNQTPAWAVDQLAKEVQAAVKLKKTLLVWLIDRSASMGTMRGALLEKLDAVYAGVEKGKGADSPLLSAVLAYAQQVQPLVEKPTADAAEVKKAIEEIKEDASGSEMTFAAVREAAERFLKARTDDDRSVIIALVTDEAGDDDNQVDDAIALLRKQAMPVYVIGIRSPMGREYVPSSNPEAATTWGAKDKKATMKTGPESMLSENIRLTFGIGFGGDDTDAIDSGFGPWALTRLANESGGTYYACRLSGGEGGAWGASDGLQHFFKPDVMRRYAPDYVSRTEFEALLKSNKARQALVDAAKLPRAEPLRNASTEFLKMDEVGLKRLLDQAQKAAAVAEPRIAQLYDALKAGEGDRPKLTGARWQAEFDLAMGRILAAKVRTEGYNAMLAILKGGKAFANADSNTFVLKHSDTIAAGSTFERMLKQSHMYLERVVKEHPDTPWAYLAERELQTPMGWEWTETRK